MDMHARIRLVRLKTAIIVVGLSVAACRDLPCYVTSRRSSEATTVYNFYCNQTCSRWMLYLLDYAKPLKGCNYQLPCTVDSKTYEANSVMARSELNLTSKNERMSLSVATGRLMLVAQCVPSSGYTNGVMVRMEDSDPGTSSITCIPPAPMQSRTSSFQGPAPSPTSARPLQSITTSELGSSEITSPPFYTIPPQLNLPT